MNYFYASESTGNPFCIIVNHINVTSFLSDLIIIIPTGEYNVKDYFLIVVKKFISAYYKGMTVIYKTKRVAICICQRCSIGYEWEANDSDNLPTQCANKKCRSPYWNKERRNKKVKDNDKVKAVGLPYSLLLGASNR